MGTLTWPASVHQHPAQRLRVDGLRRLSDRSCKGWPFGSDMIIEMLGLPGAGKSTLSRLIAQRLAFAGIVVVEETYPRDHQRGRLRRAVEKLFRALLFCVREPNRAMSAVVLIGSSRQATIFDWVGSLVNFLYLGEIYRRSTDRSDVVLLDQGVAQAAWSVGFAARNQGWVGSDDMNRLLTVRPDLVVVVHASSELILARLSQRATGASRLERKAAGRADALKRGQEQMDAILELLRARQIELVDLDNGGDTPSAIAADHVAASALGQLERLSSRRSAAVAGAGRQRMEIARGAQSGD